MTDRQVEVPGGDGSEALIGRLHPYVRHCGDERREPWRLTPRRLLDYLVVYIADGRGDFIVAGNRYDVQSGDVLWIPPDTVHGICGESPWMDLAYAHFDLVYEPTRSHWDFSIPGGMTELGELRALMHPTVDDPSILALTGRLRGHTNKRAGHLLQELCAEAARAQPLAGLRMSGILLEVVAELLRGQTAEAGGWTAHVPVLERVADEMTRRCAACPSVAALARAHGFSVSYLRDLFVRHYGCPPRTYLRQARIRKACGLMMGTNLTLSEIAGRVGFETVHSFSRAFRAVEGCSPSAYRRAGRPSTRVVGRRTPYAH